MAYACGPQSLYEQWKATMCDIILFFCLSYAYAYGLNVLIIYNIMPAYVYAYDQLKIRLYICIIMCARDTSRRRRAYLQVSAWYCLDKRSLLGATSTILAVDSFKVDGKYSIYLHDIFHLYLGMTCSDQTLSLLSGYDICIGSDGYCMNSA
jgi:hypothetical protein